MEHRVSQRQRENDGRNEIRRPVIVACYAHPDDEVLSMGGAFARYSERGYVTVVCATRGELGEISDPALATPENLAEVREAELREACRLVGVTDVRLLGYRDSGMPGTDGNQDPRAFAQADLEAVAGQLVAIFRALEPDVVVTFEETGGYGHPDHLMIHRATTRAFDAASDPNAYPEAGPAVVLGRLYYSGFPRNAMREWLRRLSEAGIDLGGIGELDLDSFGLPDDAVDVTMDVGPELERKIAAARAHRTQMGDESFMDKMPQELREGFARYEHYQLARGEALPGPRPASDLLAGWGGE